MSNDFLLRIAIVTGILAIYFCWRIYRAHQRRAQESPPDSIVLLLARHAPLNPQYLAMVVSRALGREIPVQAMDQEPGPDEDMPDCVMGASPHFMLSLDGNIFLVNSVPAPYADPAEFSESYREMRTRAALESHASWFSVDTLRRGDRDPNDHRVMGKIAAEFLGSHCLAIYDPATDLIIPVTPSMIDDLQEKLRGEEDPVAAVFRFDAMPFLPVIPVEDDNPCLVAAIEEARRRFPEFEKAFQESGGDGEFAVKIKLEADGKAEHLWVDVQGIENGRISGALANEPIGLEDYRLGSPLELDPCQIEDWCVMQEGADPLGMFTMAAIKKIEADKLRAPMKPGATS